MKKERYVLFLLLVVFILYYLLPLSIRDLWQPDEMRYAEISREMLATGDWIVPHFLGLRYFEKPVLGYWFFNLGQMLFGHTNFAVRFGSVLSTFLTALLVAELAWSIWRCYRVVLLSMLIFLTQLIVFGIGTYAVLDPILMLWLIAAMRIFWWVAQSTTFRHKVCGYLLLGVACGLGAMTKGFLAFVVPVVAILPWAIIHKKWRDLFTFGWLSLAAAAATLLPWGLAIMRREPDFWHYFFWVEHVQRFADSSKAQHKAPFWYYIPIVILGVLPWLACLPGALRAAWGRWRTNSAHCYLLCWSILPILLFSLAQGKLLTYILPCFVPLSLLMARYITLQQGYLFFVLRINGWLNVTFGLVCLAIVLLILSPWGILSKSLYKKDEIAAILLGCLAFSLWALMGFFATRESRFQWMLAGLCPLGLIMLFNSAIPHKVKYSKQPQSFISSVRHELDNSHFILVQEPGVASAVAWELQRSDIILYKDAGELKYGLRYPDVGQRYVKGEAFPDWLDANRHKGSISVVILLKKDDSKLYTMPRADFVWHEGALAILKYYPQ